MRVVLVTSESTYVLDNYLSLLDKLTDAKNLPQGIEIAGLVLIKTVDYKLALRAMGLYAIGVRRIAATLMGNMYRAKFGDPRLKLCAGRNIPVIPVENINRPEAIEKIRALDPDLIVNIRTRNIYKKEILALPKIGCVNVHHGLLPDNRGTMCDLWAWTEGRPVGFTVHWMNEKIDDGDIICTQEVDVAGVDSYADIPYRSSQLEWKRLVECFAKAAAEGRFKGIENKSQNVRFTRNPDYKQIREIRSKGFKL